MTRRLALLALLSVTFALHAQTERTVYDSFTKANALKEAFKFDEAEAEYQRCLPMALKVHGEEHKTTIALLIAMGDLHESQGNLGLVLHDLEKHVEAEQAHKRALEIREKVRGVDHPTTAESLNNLAILYRDLGRYPEAEELHKRALKIRDGALGSEHVRTI